MLSYQDIYHDSASCVYICSTCGWHGPQRDLMLCTLDPHLTIQHVCCPVCLKENRGHVCVDRIASTRFAVPFRLKYPDDTIRTTAKALRAEAAGNRHCSITDLDMAAAILESLVQ